MHTRMRMTSDLGASVCPCQVAQIWLRGGFSSIELTPSGSDALPTSAGEGRCHCHGSEGKTTSPPPLLPLSPAINRWRIWPDSSNSCRSPPWASARLPPKCSESHSPKICSNGQICDRKWPSMTENGRNLWKMTPPFNAPTFLGGQALEGGYTERIFLTQRFYISFFQHQANICMLPKFQFSVSVFF